MKFSSSSFSSSFSSLRCLFLLIFLFCCLSGCFPIRNPSSSNKWKTLFRKVLGKKDVGISVTECEVLLNNVLGKKPRQMFKLMWRKMRTIEIFLENTNKRQTYYYNEAEKEKEMKTGEILKEFLKKLRQYLVELEKFIDQQKKEEPIDIQNVSMEDWSKGQFGFGNFKISAFKWPSTADRNKVKDVFFFHKNDAKNNKNKNNKNNKNDEFFKQFIAFFAQINDEIKGKMAERWSHLDGMIDIQVSVYRKAYLFARAFTGKSGKFIADLKAHSLGLNDSTNIMMAPFLLSQSKIGKELDEDVEALERVKKFLASPKNAEIRYQTQTAGRQREYGKEAIKHTRHRTWNGPSDSSDKLVIHEQIHDIDFFEDIFAPYLEELFGILAKDEDNGGFIFKLISTKRDGHDVLAVDIGQVEKTMPNKLTMVDYYNYDDDQWREMEMNPEEGKPKGPLQLESSLLSHLLISLYAKIVDRLEDLPNSGVKKNVANGEEYALLFDAYTYALARELFKRMKEVQETDVFYDPVESFEEEVASSWETQEEAKRTERWNILQGLYLKIEQKRGEVMRQMVQKLPYTLRLMGYTDIDFVDPKKWEKREEIMQSNVEKLSVRMEAEMSFTLDNLELNWAVDCKVDDIEKCLFSEDNDIHFEMAEMSLFTERDDEMSKVQRFLNWIYKKVNKWIRKMTQKYQQQANPVKAFFMKKAIHLLEEVEELMQNRITLADVFIPFWHEFKAFVVKPTIDWVNTMVVESKEKLFNTLLALAQISGKEEKDKLFISDAVQMTKRLEGIEEKLNMKEDSGKSMISSAIKGTMRYMFKQFGLFAHVKQHFSVKRLPDLAKIYGRLKQLLMKRKKGSKRGVEGHIEITARSGIRKEWRSRLGHRILTTVAINAAYRSINIVVVNHGSLIKFGASTGFFILTIVYMTIVLWFCRNLLWSITCGAALPLCGHYISAGFAVLAIGVWLALMIAIF